MNILILSAGTRNKIVRYFKESISGKVIAADMQTTAPALYEADKFYIVPKITEPDYIDLVIDICKKEKTDAVISLIDPELSLLAENSKRFENIGVKVIGSSYEHCEMALDKMKMYRWLNSHGYNCAKSFDNKEDFYRELKSGGISFPVLVKPVRGSASFSVSRVDDSEMLESFWNHKDGLMIQEYLKGCEIGADVYVDMISHEVVSVFTKKKLRMRAGETDKAVSFRDEKLFELIERFVCECGWSCQIDIDIFEVNGEYFINEVNPRFGGGYPLAYECGCNHMKMIENNFKGISNLKSIGDYEDGIYMMKYSDVVIKKI